MNDQQTPADAALNLMVLFESGDSGCIHTVHLSNERNGPLVYTIYTVKPEEFLRSHGTQNAEARLKLGKKKKKLLEQFCKHKLYNLSSVMITGAANGSQAASLVTPGTFSFDFPSCTLRDFLEHKKYS